MKKILIVLLSTLMLSPALAFDQNDLDNIESYDQLFDFDDIVMDGITARKGGDKIDSFLRKREFVCLAKNKRGVRYQAQGHRLPNVRSRAMRKCRRNSLRPRSCHIVRCNRRGGKFSDFLDLIDLIDSL